MEPHEPPWSTNVDAKELRDTERRHEWMCTQLEMRRRHQMKLEAATSMGNGGEVAIDWYQAQLSKILPACNIEHVVEVLSDGLGFVEPNWSAITAVRQEANGIARLRGTQLNEKKAAVKLARANLARTDSPISFKFKTQRAIGKDLYEPSLFLITDRFVYFCQQGDSGRNLKRKVLTFPWLPVVGEEHTAELPLKLPLSFGKKTSSDIDNSLRDLTHKVLWTSLLPKRVQPSHCFSIVLIYTSLWQDTAGVWALHASCGLAVGEPSHALHISDLRTLIEPAIFCLEDVLGWSYEFEGTHRLKRFNVNFLYECLGKDRPHWTSDGIQYGLHENHLRDLDRTAYELPVDRLLSECIRDVFRQAVGRYHLERNAAECPAFAALSDAARTIVRAVDGAVIGMRLHDVAVELANETSSHVQTNGISDMPGTAALYLGSVESILGISHRPDALLLDRVTAIESRLLERITSIADDLDRAYCEIVIECFHNYLQKAATRLPLPAEVAEVVER